ncbi:MAG TPA: hypothetical protein VNM14_02090 [Planctomycetota bacterium]|nr:hypothetical protein [Planctomycetota bacterium]
MTMTAALLAFLDLASFSQGENSRPSDERIEESVKKGLTFLRAREKEDRAAGRPKVPRELVLWTLIVSGTPLQDPFCERLFDETVSAKPDATFPVALQAIILESLDRVRFALPIAKCAKFLADNQTEEGAWGHGSPSIYVDDIEYGIRRRPILRLPEAPQDPRVLNRVRIKQDRRGEEADPWDSFFAALGLRAAQDAGCVVESPVVRTAVEAWKDGRVGSREANRWKGSRWTEAPPAAVTASAVSSLLIYSHLLREDPRRDPAILGGADVLARSWHGGLLRTGGELHPAGLFAVGVAARLLDLPTLADQDWFAEGARLLLGAQRPDGSWRAATGDDAAEWDTCFVILFLKKAAVPQKSSPGRAPTPTRPEW